MVKLSKKIRAGAVGVDSGEWGGDDEEVDDMRDSGLFMGVV